MGGLISGGLAGALATLGPMAQAQDRNKEALNRALAESALNLGIQQQQRKDALAQALQQQKNVDRQLGMQEKQLGFEEERNKRDEIKWNWDIADHDYEVKTLRPKREKAIDLGMQKDELEMQNETIKSFASLLENTQDPNALIGSPILQKYNIPDDVKNLMFQNRVANVNKEKNALAAQNKLLDLQIKTGEEDLLSKKQGRQQEAELFPLKKREILSGINANDATTRAKGYESKSYKAQLEALKMSRADATGQLNFIQDQWLPVANDVLAPKEEREKANEILRKVNIARGNPMAYQEEINKMLNEQPPNASPTEFTNQWIQYNDPKSTFKNADAAVKTFNRDWEKYYGSKPSPAQTNEFKNSIYGSFVSTSKTSSVPTKTYSPPKPKSWSSPIYARLDSELRKAFMGPDGEITVEPITAILTPKGRNVASKLGISPDIAATQIANHYNIRTVGQMTPQQRQSTKKRIEQAGITFEDRMNPPTKSEKKRKY